MHRKTLREGRAQTQGAHVATSFLLWPASRPTRRRRAGRRQKWPARSRRRVTATMAAALPPNPHAAHLLSGTRSSSLSDPPETPADDPLSISGRPAAQIKTPPDTCSHAPSRPSVRMGRRFPARRSQAADASHPSAHPPVSLPANQVNDCGGRMGSSCRRRCSCHPTAASSVHSLPPRCRMTRRKRRFIEDS